MRLTTVVFDWDGTLLDTDEALIAPFVAQGIAREDVPWGHPLGEACAALGISMDDYLAAYDPALTHPWPGVPELLEGLVARGIRWAICSNKHPDGGVAELAHVGWNPEGSWWSDAFDFLPKRLGPVLEGLGVTADEVLYVGDTDHDVEAAAEVGCRFVLAGWNPRSAEVTGVDVAARPEDVLTLLDQA
jgi:phosphoglycolate phosphatase-like HAD superfamily hydrolase